ncbi:DUF2141 domain-containing protein [Altererythrobacter sp. Root672]|uniref:DUF2141 domain-containing protein n=1 Tax=Altererythrobacter sp. Root672 TaxID=1736584 RepID=UPI000701B4A0|nr:DUF2141 domain-containing protein [Altererythrobacter sp. Root672]KRA83647.1 hypothetical protein ASD76_06340 [Altererythrobacter sp. Root672]
MATSAVTRAAEPQEFELLVEVSHLRNAKGMVHVCLTKVEAYFPDCKADARAHRLSVAANEAGELSFRHLASGSYALSVVHDENGNGKLDTFAKIPREGYGFSGNPPMRFGPPKFGEASFTLTPGRNLQVVRMRYLL